MKAGELRIGNLVSITDEIKIGLEEEAYLINIFEVKRIEEDGYVSVHSEIENLYEYLGIDDIVPIELNIEWLSKMGFKVNRVTKEDNNIWRKEWSEGYFELEEIISFFFGSPIYSTEIKSVHHLQNIYFALTNEELQVAS
jgi:hypothetical protein